MLSVDDRNVVVRFSDRVSKREGVYVRCRRGQNRTRAGQIWRIDGGDEGVHDVGELVDDITARLLEDPSDERSFIECVGIGKSTVLDHATIAPLDTPTPDAVEDVRTIAVLTATVRDLTSQTMASRDMEVHTLRQRNEQLHDRLLEASAELGELRATLACEMVDQQSPMGEALEFFSPIVQTGLKAWMLKKTLEAKDVKALPGPVATDTPANTDPDPDPDTDTDTDADADQVDEEDAAAALHECASVVADQLAEWREQAPEAFEEPYVQAMLQAMGGGGRVPEVDVWDDAAADRLAGLLVEMATDHPHLVTPRIPQLMESPLAQLITAHLFS